MLHPLNLGIIAVKKIQLCGSLKVFVGQLFQISVSQFWGFRCIQPVIITSTHQGRHTRCLIVALGHLLRYDCNLAWTRDGRAHVSESASISDSANSKTIGGRRPLFSSISLPWIRQRGRILKRFCAISASQVTESAASSNFNTRGREGGCVGL